MKLSLALYFLCVSSLSFAAESVGDYKLQFDSMSEKIEVLFSLNSKDEVHFSEDSIYFDLSVNRFFNQLDLDFRTGGDEDFMMGAISLNFQESSPKIISKCAVFVDQPNEILMDYGTSLALYKMNPKTKKYTIIKSIKNATNCFTTIVRHYPGFEEI